MNGERDQWDDWVMLTIFGVFLLATGAAAGLMTTLSAPLRDWALGANLLVAGDSVIVPLGEGVGLDTPRLVLLIAVVVFVLALIVWAAAQWLRVRDGQRSSRGRKS